MPGSFSRICLLWERHCYYPFWTNEETKPQVKKNLPNFTQLVRGRASPQSRALKLHSQPPSSCLSTAFCFPRRVSWIAFERYIHLCTTEYLEHISNLVSICGVEDCISLKQEGEREKEASASLWHVRGALSWSSWWPHRGVLEVTAASGVNPSPASD